MSYPFSLLHLSQISNQFFLYFTSKQFKFTHQTNTYKGNIRIFIWEAHIEVVYLPKNPKINRNAKAIDKDWCVWAYRKITE